MAATSLSPAARRLKRVLPGSCSLRRAAMRTPFRESMRSTNPSQSSCVVVVLPRSSSVQEQMATAPDAAVETFAERRLQSRKRGMVHVLSRHSLMAWMSAPLRLSSLARASTSGPVLEWRNPPVSVMRPVMRAEAMAGVKSAPEA